MTLGWFEVTCRLLLAMAIGGLIGWEREIEGKPAGLRTLMLVSLGAAIYVVAGVGAALEANEPIDAMRVMAGIAGGVGFLGAGLILRTRGEVRLLTTAAAVWGAAAVGMAVGLGQYYTAALGTVLVFVTLRFIDMLEKRMPKRQKCDKEDKSFEAPDEGELDDEW